MAEDKKAPEEAFWRVADSFIAHANNQENTESGVIGAGFSYASARFNAFLIASQCSTKEAFLAEQASAVDYFVAQYRLALTENVADYTANFEKYIAQKP